jgi:hypothetical protein
MQPLHPKLNVSSCSRSFSAAVALAAIPFVETAFQLPEKLSMQNATSSWTNSGCWLERFGSFKHVTRRSSFLEILLILAFGSHKVFYLFLFIVIIVR